MYVYSVRLVKWIDNLVERPGNNAGTVSSLSKAVGSGAILQLDIWLSSKHYIYNKQKLM